MAGFDAGSRGRDRPAQPVRATRAPGRRARPGKQPRPRAPARSSASAARASSSIWAARAREFFPSISSRAICRSRGRRSRWWSIASIPKKACSCSGAKARPSTPTGRHARKGVIVEARVTKTIKGGLEVDVDGIRGFMPISQIDLLASRGRRVVRQSEVQGHRHRGQSSARKTWSSRAAICSNRSGPSSASSTWATLEEGQVHEGVVRSIKGFGAFVDIGGVDGLLPIGEMSWGRVSKVDDLRQDGRPGQGQGPQDRSHDPQAHPGAETAHAQSLGYGRRQVPSRRDWSRERSPRSWSSAASSSWSPESRG